MRSGKHAAKLQKEGVKVKNLKGSIIAWVMPSVDFVKASKDCAGMRHRKA